MSVPVPRKDPSQPELAPSRRPFAAALSDAMHARGLSWRELAELTQRADPAGKGFHAAYLNALGRGKGPKSGYTLVKEDTVLKVIEIVAPALGVPPTYFREHRELLAAQEAKRLASKIGLDEVLGALRALEASDGGTTPRAGSPTPKRPARPGRRPRAS